MPKFSPKSRQQIIGSMATKMAAETPITDFSDGSVSLTLLEVAAQEDFQAYIQMLNIIRNYNLDTTEGTDLDKRAAEYGLTREPAKPHSGFITIKDGSFTKVSTKIYAGLSGPTAGSTVIHVDDAALIPASGSLYIGRSTVNSEGPISFSAAPINNTSYWNITLDTALANDHGTDETVVLAQGGVRVVDAGTEAEIPESDVSDKVLFELNQTIQLQDGEDTFGSVLVTALNPGGFKVPANSVISFPNPPFSGATVTNPLPFVNGRDKETDQQLRDRIRNTIQSLSRGTRDAVKTSVTGLIDQNTNSSIVSANVVPPVSIADGPTKVYIDNGRGLEPIVLPIGLETLTDFATGSEKFFQLQNFPIVKANLISQNVEPFDLSGTETLLLKVGALEETFTFAATDFVTLGRAKATEVAQAINSRSLSFEARTLTDSAGKKVIITPKATSNEEIQIDSASTAEKALNFTELLVFTLKLYKNDKLLTKDGVTASVLSLAQPFNLQGGLFTTTDGDITVTPNSRIVTKSIAGSDGFTQRVSSGDYVRFVTDTVLFYRKVRSVVSDTKLILDEPYTNSGGGTGNLVIWASPKLEVAANGDSEETEIVAFGPNDFANPIQALASEVYTRLQSDLNLSTPELAVNDSKIKIISDLVDSSNSKMQVLGGGAALSMGFCSQTPLTGTLTFVGDSITVTGSGTFFTQELKEDQWIKANLDGIGDWTKIETIESDTILYLKEGYRGLNHASVAASKTNQGQLSVGSNKDYTLNRSNGQIELASALQLGDSLTAGSINTRAFVDSLPQTYNFFSLGSSSTLIVAIDGGFQGTVTTGDLSVPYNDFIDTSLINYKSNFFNGFYIEWVTGANVNQTSFVSSYNSGTGEIITTSNFSNPVLVGDKYILCQVLTFTHASAFADSNAGTAQEVVNVINAQLLGGKAQKLVSNKGRIITTNFDEFGSIQIKGGTSNAVLMFPTTPQTNELNNVAFLKNFNSDRLGNPLAIGYTLGRGQTLVAIFNGDDLNKTFSIPLEVQGNVSSVGVGNFSSLGVGSKYLAANYFKDFWLYWTSGPNAGSAQIINSYSGASGTFTATSIFPSSLPSAVAFGDSFSLVPRTAPNVVELLNDFNTTTMSIVGTADDIGVSGDFIQIATQLPGSTGRVFITGGTANSIGISITGVPGGGPVNLVTTNSIAGLSTGLYVDLTVDGAITTGDNTPAYNTFIDTSMIQSLPNYFTGMTLTFLDGFNKGFSSTISSYNNATGQIVLTNAAANALVLGDTYRITRTAYIVSFAGSVAPYTVGFNDQSNTVINVSGFTSNRKAAIRDNNGLNFSTVQVEGVDGYKYFYGLIQKAQWTIDGLDRDAANYPGIGAAGTQFEVISPAIVNLKLILSVIPEDGVTLSSISDAVKTAVEQYINSLGVGQEVVLSAIIAAARSVSGVFDASISNYTSNILILDGQLARIDPSNLLVG